MKKSKQLFIILLCLIFLNLFIGVLFADDNLSKLEPALKMLLFSSNNKTASGATLHKAMGIASKQDSGQNSVRILIKTSASKEYINSIYPGIKTYSKLGSVVTAEVPVDVLQILSKDPNVEYVEVSKQVFPQMDVVVSDQKVNGAYLGISASSAQVQLGGAGVIFGIVDTGIDWTHKDFIVDETTISRILYLWDQTLTKTSGENSPVVGYGVEYTKDNITNELKGFTYGKVRSTDTEGHGTHVTGIAAGDGSSYEGKYKGIAPKADIISVKGLGNLSDTCSILDGISYIISKAEALGKPVVINLSIGLNYGPHDGSSNFESAINSAVGTGKIICVAAGNNQRKGQHYNKDNQALSDFESVDISGDLQSAPSLFIIDIWHSAGDKYNLLVSNELDYAIIQYGSTIIKTMNGGNIIVDNASSTATNGDKEIVLIIQKNDSNTHTWSFLLFRSSDSVGDGCWDAYSEGENMSFLGSSAYETITEPGNAENVITVGAYTSKLTWTDFCGLSHIGSGVYGDAVLGDIAGFSSIGPTRSTTIKPGRMKPDIVAPGERIASAMSGDSLPSDLNDIVLGMNHVLKQGTSMACPVISGMCALILQKKPRITPSEIKQLLTQNARTDNYTGVVPNIVFGYGKANASFITALTADTYGNDNSSDVVTGKINSKQDVDVTFNTTFGKVDLFILAETFSDDVTLTLSTVSAISSSNKAITTTNIAIEINAGGQQPGKPITIYYNPATLPSGFDESKLAIASKVRQHKQSLHTITINGIYIRAQSSSNNRPSINICYCAIKPSESIKQHIRIPNTF